MKKVININFQGRVIPIEETAFEQLKQYIESLRRYFAQEEGRDEIINDIESRIAELFSERLKKGSTCITDDDVNAVIASMGRPEDFDAEFDTASSSSNNSSSTNTGNQQQSQQTPPYGSSTTGTGRGRLYRNVDDKIIGGVASGLANYFGIDPVVVRILFVLLIAPLFWVYILLWIIIPSRSMQTNITKRLYRSADDKVIAGVCGGLAAYFKIDTWIPRLIFALPLIIGLVSGPFNFFWDDFDFWWGPKIITGSLSSTLFFTYVILWIAVPVAVTAAEKLEMRGEEVNLNSIRDTVNEERETFKSRAEKWGNEVKQSAQEFGEKAREFGQEAGSRAKVFAAEAGPAARGAANGVGHVIGVLFKAFFLFIAGAIAIGLFGLLVGLLFGGFAALPLKDFLLEGFWQNVFAWCTLLLFLGVPLVALIIWLIRRIAGVRSKNSYLGYIFGGLWTIGIISVIFLIATVTKNFKTRSAVEEQVTLVQPSASKLYVDVASNNAYYYGGDLFGVEWDEWPFYALNPDTVMLNTVRVDVVKSPDSAFHVTKVKLSRANTTPQARTLAEKINYDVMQRDTTLILPKGFAISRHEKFRNQQVLVIIQVPVGKRIQLDRSVSDFEWFDVRFNRHGGLNIDLDEDWNKTYWLSTGVEYVMTNDGPKRVDQLDPKELKSGKFKMKIGDGHDEVNIEIEGPGIRTEEPRRPEEPKRPDEPSVKKDSVGGYRYRGRNNDNKQQKTDTATDKKITLNFSAKLHQHC